LVRQNDRFFKLSPKRRFLSKTGFQRFEILERSRAVNYGGIGAMHLMGQKLGLAEEIDGRVKLLKVHLAYHEAITS
jgi:hypothetical protein